MALLGVLSAVMDLHHQKCPAQKAGHETGSAPLQPHVDTAAENYGQNYDDYDDEDDDVGAEAVHSAAPSRIRPFYTLGDSPAIIEYCRLQQGVLSFSPPVAA
jgi:hypothetical protein